MIQKAALERPLVDPSVILVGNQRKEEEKFCTDSANDVLLRNVTTHFNLMTFSNEIQKGMYRCY